MVDRELKRIEIEGYASIRSASVTLGRLNVLVGANGAGKSNFVRVFEMLGRLVDGQLGLFVGVNGGAGALINTFSSEIRVHLHGPPNAYEAVLLPASGDELVFGHEVVYFQADGYDRPYKKLIGHGHRESKLHEASDKLSSYVVNLLEGCRVYHFHDTSRDAPVKRSTTTADNITLRSDAANLAAVLLSLRDSSDATDRAAYRRIVGTIKQVAPFFRDFVLRPQNGDRIMLRWQQNDSDATFSADQMSDGTLRFVCLATLLLHPGLPSVVVLDEPELGLHPFAVGQLAGLLRSASARSQVLIATQSVTLMNQFGIEDLIVVGREAGGSTFTRPDPEQLQEWLEEYSLGELWEKNLLGGRPGGRS